MLRGVTRVLWYEFKDVKSKTILEKLAKTKVKQGMNPADVDMEQLARESGLAPSNVASLQHFMDEKEAVLGMLQEQRLRRIARREAFLEWQAGQREKGAAHRLLRQARKAEKYKRRHYHATSGRMVPVLQASQGSNTAPTAARHNRSLPQLTSLSGAASADDGELREWSRIPLTLGKKW